MKTFSRHFLYRYFRYQVMLVSVFVVGLRAEGSTLTTLHTFGSYPSSNPASLIQGSDGNFYGTTQGGGSGGLGTVFKLTPSGVLTNLFSFSSSGNDGTSPQAPLVRGTDGNFYGTCRGGGAASPARGTIFRITTSGIFTKLHDFNGTDGRDPLGGLVEESPGNFYGTTQFGGTSDRGTIFKITSLGVFTNLFSFNLANGGSPQFKLARAGDGNLYGTTISGGAGNLGTIFRITPTGTFTMIFDFSGAPPEAGGLPLSGLAYRPSDGLLYGSTAYGSIYKVSTAGGLTPIHQLNNATEGYNAHGTLVLGSDDNFYGATEYGPGSTTTVFFPGSIFKITPSGVFTTIRSFAGPSTTDPQMVPWSPSLVEGSDSNLYGVKIHAGPSGLGEIFSVTHSGTESSLYLFALNTDGSPVFPTAVLLETTAGSFYGTTYGGGAFNSGTIYQITSSGDFNVIYEFRGDATDGVGPEGGLVQGLDGNFYGTAAGGGGASGFGTVFKLTPPNTVSVVHSFSDSDGSFPRAPLFKASDGTLYGTTNVGGTSSAGTIFKIPPMGSLSVIHHFTGSDGRNPVGGVVEDTEGNLYGTTQRGGTSAKGTVFKITPSGTFTSLVSFVGNNGDGPRPSLVRGQDGLFYGTTLFGGISNFGVVFKITTLGVFTKIYDFAGADGSLPRAGLVVDSDGSFYGTTQAGGVSDQGTIYKITPLGALTTLHSFSGNDGRVPWFGMTKGSDGKFYGTTRQAESDVTGTIFQFAPGTGVGISGTISYCSNPVPGPVPNVTLNLTGDTTTSTLSDSSGNYTFSSLPSGGTYTVTPNKAARIPGSAGINTVDVIATQRHFLNLGTLLAGCRLMAANVNGDSSVNTVDVIAIQRFFLGLSSGIANVGKYKFTPVNRSYSGVVSNQTGQNYDTLVFGDTASSFVELVDGPSDDNG